MEGFALTSSGLHYATEPQRSKLTLNDSLSDFAAVPLTVPVGDSTPRGWLRINAGAPRQLCKNVVKRVDVSSCAGHVEGEGTNHLEEILTDHDQLDRLLNDSSPKTTALNNDLNDALMRMTLAAKRHPEARVRRRLRKPATIALAAALVFGGAGVAAAAGGWQWHPWAETPDAVFMVTYPSGTQCEYRLGAMSGGTTEELEAVRSFAAQTDLAALADVDRYIMEARARGQWIYDDNDVQQPNGPGTALYDADWEYQQAFGHAVNALIRQHLADEGIPSAYTGGGIEFRMQGDCGGTE